MRRRPLLRAAAVGGVAYMGAKAGSNKAAAQQQAAQGGQQAPAAPPPPAVAAAPDRISQLKELASLHDSGALTDEEFETEKSKVLAT